MPKKIVAVTDNKSVIQNIQKSLHGKDIALIEATSGEMGASFAFTESPDLIIADNDLKDLPGVKYVQRVKADANIATVPIIIILSKPDPAVQEMIKLGVTEFLVNPFEKNDLIDAIDRTIGTLAKSDEGTINIEPQKAAGFSSDATVVIKPGMINKKPVTDTVETPPSVKSADKMPIPSSDGKTMKLSDTLSGFTPPSVGATPPPAASKGFGTAVPESGATVVLSAKELLTQMNSAKKDGIGMGDTQATPPHAQPEKSAWGSSSPTLKSVFGVSTPQPTAAVKTSIFDTAPAQVPPTVKSPEAKEVTPTHKQVNSVFDIGTIKATEPAAETSVPAAPKIEIEHTAFKPAAKSVFDTPAKAEGLEVFSTPKKQIFNLGEDMKVDIEHTSLSPEKSEEKPAVETSKPSGFTFGVEPEPTPVQEAEKAVESSLNPAPLEQAQAQIQENIETQVNELQPVISEPAVEFPGLNIDVQSFAAGDKEQKNEEEAGEELSQPKCFYVKFNSSKNMFALMKGLLENMREEELDNVLKALVTDKKPILLLFEASSSVLGGGTSGLRSAVKAVFGDDAPIVIVKKENAGILPKLTDTTGVKVVELNAVVKK
ncbi:MAG: response regulator [Elusimicrobiota bacterium]